MGWATRLSEAVPVAAVAVVTGREAKYSWTGRLRVGGRYQD